MSNALQIRKMFLMDTKNAEHGLDKLVGTPPCFFVYLQCLQLFSCASVSVSLSHFTLEL